VIFGPVQGAEWGASFRNSPTKIEGLEQGSGRGSDPILALKIKAFKIKESLDSVGT